MTERSRSVTLRDVAARVGVTTAAVSMALSDTGRIGVETKQRIRDAAAELGYVPSSAGRALRKRRSDAIAVIVPATTHHVFGHMYFMHVLTGVSSVTNEHGAQLLISTDSDEAGGVSAYERVLGSRSADGALVTSAAIGDPNVERLATSGLAVVLIGSFPEFPDAASVWIDDVAASRGAAEHLIRVHGRQRLVHVTGPLDHQSGADRLAGFRAAVDAAGIGDAALVLEGDFSEQSGTDAAERSLEAGADGGVFANDDMAFGAMTALRARGIDIPGRISVCGFDDFGIARLTSPALTTVHVPAEELARTATERLFALLDGRPAPDITTLPTDLRVRESCGCGV